MAVLKDLPVDYLPREKAKRFGIEALNDDELLTILLRSGYHGENASELSNRIINQFLGLLNLSEIPYEELIKIKGIKESKALILITIFEIHKRLKNYELLDGKKELTTDDIYKLYKNKLSKQNFESLILIILDNKKRIKYERILGTGYSNNVSFDFKKFWSILFTHNGYGFYLVHNHPSGDCSPSNEDIMLTTTIIRESKKYHFRFIDHIIIGENSYISMQNILKT